MRKTQNGKTSEEKVDGKRMRCAVLCMRHSRRIGRYEMGIFNSLSSDEQRLIDPNTEHVHREEMTSANKEDKLNENSNLIPLLCKSKNLVGWNAQCIKRVAESCCRDNALTPRTELVLWASLLYSYWLTTPVSKLLVDLTDINVIKK